MTTIKKDLRATLLPYCLQRLPDGSYIALNRDYKPLGFIGCGWVRYEDYPARFRFVRKPSPATIRALSARYCGPNSRGDLCGFRGFPLCGPPLLLPARHGMRGNLSASCGAQRLRTGVAAK